MVEVWISYFVMVLAGYLMGLAVLSGVLWVLYYLVTLPMRRQERAKMFLSVLDIGLRQGRSVQDAICSLADAREKSMGRGLREVALNLGAGLGLGEALRSVPGFLPPHVNETLAVGEKTGDLTKMIAACRRTQADAVSRTRGALNYVYIFATGIFMGGMVFLPLFVVTFIIPRFEAIFADLGTPVPTILRLLQSGWLRSGLLAMALALVLGAILYIDGQRIAGSGWLKPLFDRIVFLLPWRRKRLKRDFSVILAALLDSGVPESEAVWLAAKGTANAVLKGRAEAAVTALSAGEGLSEAVSRLDGSGELRWHLDNAAHGGGGFLDALSGWHDALDAKAFQQEQAAAHIVSTGILLINGAVTAMFAVGVLGALLSVMTSVF